MRCLVTGAGLLGRALTDALRARGDEVTLTHYRPVPGAEVMDVRDLEAVRRGVVGYDAVFHTAGLHGFRDGSRLEFFETNVRGTWNLCEAMLEAGVSRLVYSSTVGVYGDARELVLDNDTPGVAAVSVYNESKQVAESIVAWYARTQGLSAVALRYGGFIETIEAEGAVTAAWRSSGALVSLDDVVRSNLHAVDRLPLPRFAYVVIPSGGEPGGPYRIDASTTEADLGMRFSTTYDDIAGTAD